MKDWWMMDVWTDDGWVDGWRDGWKNGWTVRKEQFPLAISN
jgi:hypothetical protein